MSMPCATSDHPRDMRISPRQPHDGPRPWVHAYASATEAAPRNTAAVITAPIQAVDFRSSSITNTTSPTEARTSGIPMLPFSVAAYNFSATAATKQQIRILRGILLNYFSLVFTRDIAILISWTQDSTGTVMPGMVTFSNP